MGSVEVLDDITLHADRAGLAGRLGLVLLVGDLVGLLIMATVAGNFDIAQELVRHGANANAKDHVRLNAPRGVVLLPIRVD